MTVKELIARLQKVNQELFIGSGGTLITDIATGDGVCWLINSEELWKSVENYS